MGSVSSSRLCGVDVDTLELGFGYISEYRVIRLLPVLVVSVLAQSYCVPGLVPR